jgi:hypothetical protein
MDKEPQAKQADTGEPRAHLQGNNATLLWLGCKDLNANQSHACPFLLPVLRNEQYLITHKAEQDHGPTK